MTISSGAMLQPSGLYATELVWHFLVIVEKCLAARQWKPTNDSPLSLRPTVPGTISIL